jgi:hypothetical protein
MVISGTCEKNRPVEFARFLGSDRGLVPKSGLHSKTLVPGISRGSWEYYFPSGCSPISLLKELAGVEAG